MENLSAKSRAACAELSKSVVRSNISWMTSSPRAPRLASSSFRNAASSWQFGHQLPPTVTSTTLPAWRSSGYCCRLPSRSGKLNSSRSTPGLRAVRSAGLSSFAAGSRRPLNDFLGAAAGELLAGEHAVAAEAREVEVRRAAVEARQEQRVAARLAGDVAVVAALAQHGARHDVAVLGEFRDAGAFAAVGVAKRQRPASREIERRGVGLREEAPGLAGHGDEAQFADDAARAQDVERAFEAPVLERRLDAVLVARHLDREIPVLEPHAGRAHALRAIDQVGDEAAVLAHELEPEGQVAAVGRDHGAIDAERRRVGPAAGREQGGRRAADERRPQTRARLPALTTSTPGAGSRPARRARVPRQGRCGRPRCRTCAARCGSSRARRSPGRGSR